MNSKFIVTINKNWIRIYDFFLYKFFDSFSLLIFKFYEIKVQISFEIKYYWILLNILILMWGWCSTNKLFKENRREINDSFSNETVFKRSLFMLFFYEWEYICCTRSEFSNDDSYRFIRLLLFLNLKKNSYEDAMTKTSVNI